MKQPRTALVIALLGLATASVIGLETWHKSPASTRLVTEPLLRRRRQHRLAVGQAGKSGWVYILDRRTGRQIRRSDPFIPLENVFPTPTRKGTRASPAIRGGASWPPPAYSPATGLMYVLGSYIPMLFTLDPAQKAGEPYRNAEFKKLSD